MHLRRPFALLALCLVVAAPAAFAKDAKEKDLPKPKTGFSQLSATPPTYRSAPPVLGEHTEAVLSGILGMSAAEIETLRAKGIL